MKPTRVLWRTQADLMAADATALASVTAMHLHLAQNAFAPGLDLTLAALTEATFPGYAALLAGTGVQTVYYDAITGNLSIVIKAPAGGWKWVSTGAPGSPQTIYGTYLTDNADAVLYGAYLLDNPITISATGQGIDLLGPVLQFSGLYPQ